MTPPLPRAPLARRRPADSVGPPRELEALFVEEGRILDDPNSSYEERALVQHRKWDLIHGLLESNPFQVSTSLPRHAQWQRVLSHVKRCVGEQELVDWVIQQRDVNANIAAGIQDLRPRKCGPCYKAVMEFVYFRREKARAVLDWTRGENVVRRPSFPASSGPGLSEND